MFQGSTNLKFFKRLNIYKNSTGTVEYNPETRQGRSYRWTFLAPINGILVFNEYKWSPTTSGHQSAVRSVLKDQSYIVVDAGTDSPLNFSKTTTEKLFKKLIEKQVEIELARSKNSKTHGWRVSQYNSMTENLKKIESIKGLKISQKRKNEIIKEVYDSVFDDLNEKASEKNFKTLLLEEAETNLNPIEL